MFVKLSSKDSIVTILHIQNSIILIQTTEYQIHSNNAYTHNIPYETIYMYICVNITLHRDFSKSTFGN